MSVKAAASLAAAAAVASGFLLAAATALRHDGASARRVREERVRLVMAETARSAREALMAKDPLMLLDSLGAVRRAHPAVATLRVKSDAGLQTVGLPPAAGEPVRFEVVEVAVAGGRRARVEATFLESALAAPGRLERRALLGALARAGLGAAVAAGLLAWLWLRGPVRRIEEERRAFLDAARREVRVPLAAIDSLARYLKSVASLRAPREAEHVDRILLHASRVERFLTSLLGPVRPQKS